MRITLITLYIKIVDSKYLKYANSTDCFGSIASPKFSFFIIRIGANWCYKISNTRKCCFRNTAMVQRNCTSTRSTCNRKIFYRNEPSFWKVDSGIMPHQKLKVIFLNDAVVQLQQRIHYYNTVQSGLGKRCGLKVKSAAAHFV